MPNSESMKKKPPSHEVEDEHGVEILKAAAQAWHSRSGSSRSSSSTSEFDAQQKSYKAKPPTRFRAEAMSKNGRGAKWDFRESLWDSYEIVAVSRRLEAGMVLDDPFEGSGRVVRRIMESKNSLRSLFNVMSSRRFVEPQHKLRLF